MGLHIHQNYCPPCQKHFKDIRLIEWFPDSPDSIILWFIIKRWNYSSEDFWEAIKSVSINVKVETGKVNHTCS